MKTFILGAFAIPASILLLFASCSDSDKREYDKQSTLSSEVVSIETAEKTQADIAEDHNNAKFDKAEQKDAQFVVDAAIFNLSEIETGNYVLSQTRSSSVKELAKKVVITHTQLYAELNGLAGRGNITIPAQLGEKESKGADKLRDSGANFDKKYTTMLVNQHKKLIDLFEAASTNSQDADLKSWADNKLPALRKLLDQSMVLNEGLKD